MGRGTCKFRQREITRTIKAARAAGVAVERIEVETDGKIVVHVGGNDPKKFNTADAVLEKLKHDHDKT
jgi:precorrin-3B methylase